MPNYIALFVALVFTFQINCLTSVTQNDSLSVFDDEIDYCFTKRVDSLLISLYIDISEKDSSYFFSITDVDNLILDVHDSIYRERLEKIATPLELNYNRLVQSYINRYIKRGQVISPRLLGLSYQYFPIFEEIIDAYQLPYELKYLPAIESAFNPHAVSRAGATGIWQIMYRTGIYMGLEINSFVDERRCPYKSTHAALQYLQALYNSYQCWNLALAAYNCGPGCVNNAIRRAGGETNYWKISGLLPRETRNYIPAYTAVIYMFNYYDYHNYKPIYFDFINNYDTVMITSNLHFQQVNEVLGVPIAELRQLNPQYKLDIIPENENKNYPLRLRRDYISDFIALEDSIYKHKDSIFFHRSHFKYSPVAPIVAARQREPQPPNTTELEYTVKSGDVIGTIAERYGVSARQLRGWNGLSSNTIRIGQTLSIYVPEDKAEKYRNIADDTNVPNHRIATAQRSQIQNLRPLLTGEFFYYTVQRGDSPWTIANKHPGVSLDDILNLNGLDHNSTLRVGQEIKIPKK